MNVILMHDKSDIGDFGGNGSPTSEEIVALLREALPSSLMALVQHIGQITRAMDMSLYVVGGFVRDLLLGQANTDIDFVVEGDAIALVERLSSELGGETRSHSRFGTGKWLLDEDVWRKFSGDAAHVNSSDLPNSIDFASARTEFYTHPTALPQVERSGIKLDLHRRDFSINTLAIQLDEEHPGRLLDFWGGLRDLRQGTIRVLHNLSFTDDPTRILRAARLEQRLSFHIEPRTEELIELALPILEQVSGDRVRHEIESIFAERHPEAALERLQGMGVLTALQPGLRVDGWLRGAYGALRRALRQPLWPELSTLLDVEMPYFALLTRHLDEVGLHAICKRLKVQRKTLQDLMAARTLLERLSALADESLRPSEVDELLHPFNDRVLLVGWAGAVNGVARSQIERYALHLRYVQPQTDGHALLARGIPRGPEIGVILRELRSTWLDGLVTDASGEQAILDVLLKSTSGK